MIVIRKLVAMSCYREVITYKKHRMALKKASPGVSMSAKNVVLAIEK